MYLCVWFYHGAKQYYESKEIYVGTRVVELIFFLFLVVFDKYWLSLDGVKHEKEKYINGTKK